MIQTVIILRSKLNHPNDHQDGIHGSCVAPVCKYVCWSTPVLLAVHTGYPFHKSEGELAWIIMKRQEGQNPNRIENQFQIGFGKFYPIPKARISNNTMLTVDLEWSTYGLPMHLSASMVSHLHHWWQNPGSDI